MAIKVGCFALIDPFSVLEHQLDRIRDWGFECADVTDSTDGGSMGVEYGFAAEALFLIRERLYEPLRIAADHGVKSLLEPHGKSTDSIDHMEKILELCNSPALGVNMDSGNSWLGGTDPVEMVKRLGSQIEHEIL